MQFSVKFFYFRYVFLSLDSNSSIRATCYLVKLILFVLFGETDFICDIM